MRRTTLSRSPSRRRLPVAVLAALALLPVGVASASARTHRFLDPAHDAVRISQDQEVHPAPHRRDVDIRRAVLRHGLARIEVRLQLRGLEVGQTVMDVAYVTDRTHTSPAELFSSEVRWNPVHPHRPVVTITAGHVTCFTGPGSLRADGIRTRTYYGAGVVSLSFPRRCLSRNGSQPAWFRARITVHTGERPLYWDEVSYPRSYPRRHPFGHFSRRVYAGPRTVSGGKTRHDT